ncbi:MAG: glucose-6-phosphate isomerase, partial [Bacteroidota bacterium]
MKNIQLDLSNCLPFIQQKEFNAYKALIEEKVQMLNNKTGKGRDFLGWLDLPKIISQTEIDDIKNTAADLKKISDVIVVIGIGGSYLGAKAVIKALSGHFNKNTNTPEIIFAGHNLSEDYHYELIKYLKEKT